jgi:hypothetical protein
VSQRIRKRIEEPFAGSRPSPRSTASSASPPSTPDPSDRRRPPGTALGGGEIDHDQAREALWAAAKVCGYIHDHGQATAKKGERIKVAGRRTQSADAATSRGRSGNVTIPLDRSPAREDQTSPGEYASPRRVVSFDWLRPTRSSSCRASPRWWADRPGLRYDISISAGRSLPAHRSSARRAQESTDPKMRALAPRCGWCAADRTGPSLHGRQTR